MSFDPKTGGPCYLADIRRGALKQIAQVRSDHEKWETPKVSEERHTPLLPCPFCGGTNIHDLKNFDWVACQDCGAELEDVQPSARELWNTRADQSALPALVKALEEIKLLLSAAKNDGKPNAVKESNANQAWHTADAALASIRGEK